MNDTKVCGSVKFTWKWTGIHFSCFFQAWEVDTLRGHVNNVSSVMFHPKQVFWPQTKPDDQAF